MIAKIITCNATREKPAPAPDQLLQNTQLGLANNRSFLEVVAENIQSFAARTEASPPQPSLRKLLTLPSGCHSPIRSRSHSRGRALVRHRPRARARKRTAETGALTHDAGRKRTPSPSSFVAALDGTTAAWNGHGTFRCIISTSSGCPSTCSPTVLASNPHSVHRLARHRFKTLSAASRGP